jgi:preprotein translocase subunit SecD
LLQQNEARQNEVHEAAKPVCEADLRPTQQARNVGSWSALRILPLEAPAPSADTAQAELDRLGGYSGLFAVDAGDLRKMLLDGLRAEVRATLREARIFWSSPPMIRDGAVEVRIRDLADIDRAAKVLASILVAPDEPGADRGINITDAGDGVLHLAPTDAALASRMRTARDFSLSIVQRRLLQLGIANASVQAEDADRIRVVIPGIARLPSTHPLESLAHLDVRLVDISMSPCEALQKGAPAGSDVLFRSGSHTADRVKTPYLVTRRVLAEGSDLVEVVAALDETGEPIVAFRVDSIAAARFINTVRAHVGEPLAILLDNEVVALATIAEPLDRSVRILGGLTRESAKEFAMLLRANMGVFVRLNVVEQQVIAPKTAK